MTSAEKSATGDVYDPSTLPDFDRQFIDPDDLRQFENALNGNEADPPSGSQRLASHLPTGPEKQKPANKT
ncbi:uncharacterized protein ATNIH1004_011334 [Aspergillus tanneri]|uniref:Uncharacterized protein n=1 Tax=Aspergillus tanneri TaxID=1220188 RepID=A0A5M9MAC3_9EURO|nr:uncharacterized protein ATNIH1004_011334 [Aspergillus tanneri]KAA8642390.1 hypothetical protein ATNIH1004_011334 [Aspergillus tanneri]